MTPDAVRRQAVERFHAAFGAAPAKVGIAPARVNLIGEHVDYVGGLVLPAAVDRYVAVALATSEAWEVSSEIEGGLVYVRALAGALSRGPLRVAIASDVPAGAGLSSSAALLVAVVAALAPELAGVEVARLCQAAEQASTGVQVGIMDQFASALGRQGHAILLDCSTLEHQWIPLPADLSIAVVSSGISRSLAETPYNLRRQEAEAAVAGQGGPRLAPRLRHVISEISRTGQFAAALDHGDRALLGRLMNASHVSLRDDFEVSIPAVDRLVELAWGAPGCVGARIMGAGFGGSVVALVDKMQVGAFEAAVAAPVTVCATVSGPFSA